MDNAWTAVSWIVDVVIVMLLIMTVIYSMYLSKQLKTLRNGSGQMAANLETMGTYVEQIRGVLVRECADARQVIEEMTQRTYEARACEEDVEAWTHDMQRLIRRGENCAARLKEMDKKVAESVPQAEPAPKKSSTRKRSSTTKKSSSTAKATQTKKTRSPATRSKSTTKKSTAPNSKSEAKDQGQDEGSSEKVYKYDSKTGSAQRASEKASA